MLVKQGFFENIKLKNEAKPLANIPEDIPTHSPQPRSLLSYQRRRTDAKLLLHGLPRSYASLRPDLTF